MSHSKITITSSLEQYQYIYSANAPKNVEFYAKQLHQTIGKLITVQCQSIVDIFELIELNKQMDSFIRSLKEQFNLIHFDLNSYEYPIFVSKLEKLNFFEELNEYNSSIITILKLAIIRIDASSNESQAKKYVLDLINSEINNFIPSFEKQTLFEDPPETCVSDRVNNDINSEVKELIRKQLDIII